MSRVTASELVPGRIAGAEALWYDTSRWPSFVDGFATVTDLDPDWPLGGRVVWVSKPHGRGRVVERVQRHEVRTGQTNEVEDERLAGTQTVAFEAAGDDTRVTLTLDYSLKDAGPLSVVVDALFIRRALRDAMRRTLRRFAAEREGDIALGAD